MDAEAEAREQKRREFEKLQERVYIAHCILYLFIFVAALGFHLAKVFVDFTTGFKLWDKEALL